MDFELLNPFSLTSPVVYIALVAISAAWFGRLSIFKRLETLPSFVGLVVGIASIGVFLALLTHLTSGRLVQAGALLFAVLAGRAQFGPIESLYKALVLRLMKDTGSFGRRMAIHVEKTFADSTDPLLKGDLLTFAKAQYAAKFPELFDEAIPDDIEQSVIQDSRLVTGERLSRLAPRRLDTKGLIALYDANLNRVARQLPTMFIVAGILGVGAYFGTGKVGELTRAPVAAKPVNMNDAIAETSRSFGGFGAPSAMGGSRKPATQMQPQAPRNIGPTLSDLPARDLWGKADLDAAHAEASAAASKRNDAARAAFADAQSKAARNQSIARWAAVGASVIVGLLVTFGVFAVLVGFATLRLLKPRSIAGAVNALIDDPTLTVETKESVVRWKRRQEKHRNQRNAYREQIAQIRRDEELIPELKGFAVEMGTATGTLAYRGSMVAYQALQRVRMRLEDLHQNMLIVGGIGSGKTFSVLEPMMRQVADLALHLLKSGSKLRVALFVMGGKGNEWLTAKEIAEEKGAKVQIIGTGRDEFGFDLVDGMEPHIFSETVNSVMEMLSGQKGGGSDPIWSSVASMIVHASATVARAWEVTPQGRQRAYETRERIYSPVNIYALAMSVREPQGLLYHAIDAICTSCKDAERNPQMKVLMTADLWDAITFLRKDLLSFPPATVGSFLANVSNALRGFTALADVRRAFGGCSGNTLDVGRVYEAGTITAVNLSPVEQGSFGRIAAIMIKTRVYHRAISENLFDKAIRFKRKLFVFLDEFQDVMTRGGALSEAGTLLNRSRESGLSIIAATQGVPALYNALGESSGGYAIKNLLEMFKTTLFLQTTGRENLEMMQMLAGKAMRSTVIEDSQYEGRMAQQMESGDDVMSDVVTPFEVNDSMAARLVRNVAPLRTLVFAGTRKDVRVDWDMYAVDHSKGSMWLPSQEPNTDWIEKLKSVKWRAEDKRDQMMQQGHAEENLIHEDDPQTFGRGQGFLIGQVGGHIRMDIVKFNPMAGRSPKKPVKVGIEEAVALAPPREEAVAA